VHRGVAAVAEKQGMTAMKSGPARVPLIAPSILRVYGLRTAAIFLVMILAVGAGTFMLREAATAQVIGRARGTAATTARHRRWLEHARRHRVARPATSIRRLEQPRRAPHRSAQQHQHDRGNNALGAGFSGDYGPATARSSTRRTASRSRLTAT
jgi:hypothetical protein